MDRNTQESTYLLKGMEQSSNTGDFGRAEKSHTVLNPSRQTILQENASPQYEEVDEAIFEE